MAMFFTTRPGAVVRLDDPALQCTSRFMSVTPTITYDVQKSIVTRIVVSQNVNVQFLHTFGSQIFIYVFGDRMGQVSLSGLSFHCTCPELGIDDSTTGPEEMYNWYKANRASRRLDPVLLSIGRSALIEGFVTGFTEDVVDASIRLVQWGVSMQTLPDNES